VLLPDVPNWSWHEYGMRVGAWRFFELFARRGIRPTLALMPASARTNPRVAEEARRSDWEILGHGYDQVPIHKNDDQVAMIDRCLDILQRFCAAGRSLARAGPDPDPGDARSARRRPASNISATGSMTTSRPRSAPPTARWSRCRTRSSSTTSR